MPTVHRLGEGHGQLGGATQMVPTPSSNGGPSSGVLWGAAAAGVIGAATAYALEQRRKRKQEEARQRAEAMEEVARRNAEREAVKVRNFLAAEAKRKEKALLAAQAADMRRIELAEMTEAEWLAGISPNTVSIPPKGIIGLVPTGRFEVIQPPKVQLQGSRWYDLSTGRLQGGTQEPCLGAN